MKIRINEHGYLEIYRKNQWKQVECKGCVDYKTIIVEGCKDYNKNIKCYEAVDIHNYTYRPCGDWCALFGEPEIEPSWDRIENKMVCTDLVIIKLCKKEIIANIKDFEDLRV